MTKLPILSACLLLAACGGATYPQNDCPYPKQAVYLLTVPVPFTPGIVVPIALPVYQPDVVMQQNVVLACLAPPTEAPSHN